MSSGDPLHAVRCQRRRRRVPKNLVHFMTPLGGIINQSITLLARDGEGRMCSVFLSLCDVESGGLDAMRRPCAGSSSSSRGRPGDRVLFCWVSFPCCGVRGLSWLAGRARGALWVVLAVDIWCIPIMPSSHPDPPARDSFIFDKILGQAGQSFVRGRQH
jgi:hypothetical protein